MKAVKSINDVKANRSLARKINTDISTLKCYNFDLKGDEIENSSFLIEMEDRHHTLHLQNWKNKRSG